MMNATLKVFFFILDGFSVITPHHLIGVCNDNESNIKMDWTLAGLITDISKT